MNHQVSGWFSDRNQADQDGVGLEFVGSGHNGDPGGSFGCHGGILHHVHLDLSILAISMSVSVELQTTALGGWIVIEIHPFS